MCTATRFDNYIDAFFILLNYRQGSTRRLQQSGKFGLNKTTLLFRIAHMTEWRTHVERAAYLTLEQHVVAPQVYLGGFTCGAQLLQVTVAEFVLLVPFVTDGLSIGDALRYGRRCRGRGWISFCDVCCHDSLLRTR